MSAPRRRETVSAAYVLGAGGAHSVTRYSMQQHLDGETYDGRYIVADAKIRLPGPPDCSRIVVGPTGFGLFSPLPGDRRLIFVDRDALMELSYCCNEHILVCIRCSNVSSYTLKLAPWACLALQHTFIYEAPTAFREPFLNPRQGGSASYRQEPSMAKPQDEQERPCLHCMMVELIDDFLAENPTTAGSDKVDAVEADEVIDAIAKTVAELTSQQHGVIRQQVIEQLMQQIMHYDGEFRREETIPPAGSRAKH
jgi:hypothetical protein